jgi:transcriptional regulator with XRE-family HTH domain
MVQNSVADNVRAEMARRNKSQADIAQQLGITRQGISRRLLGRTPFDVDEIAAIARYLNVPVGVLFGTDDAKASA